MAKFQVLASERVFYNVEVEAKDEAELKKLISIGDIDWGNVVEGDDFCIDYIEELKGV